MFYSCKLRAPDKLSHVINMTTFEFFIERDLSHVKNLKIYTSVS